MLQRVLSRYSVETFSAKNFRRGTLVCCVSENSQDKKSLDKREGGVSRFSIENFLSYSGENFGRVTLYCFTIFGFRKI